MDIRRTQNDQEEKVVYVGDSRVRDRKSNNIPVDYTANPGKTEVFIPNFLLKEWMVGSIVLVGILTLAMVYPAPLGGLADPTDTNFVPIPDWYFLFLYQILKYPYLANEFIVLGAVIVPGLAFGALTLVPLIDTGKERIWYRRPIGSALMIFSIITTMFLTKVAWDEYIDTLIERGIDPDERYGQAERPAPPTREPAVTIIDPDSAGYEIYRRSSCVNCHAADLTGMGNLPGLRAIGDKYNFDELMNIVYEGIGGMAAQYDDLVANYDLTDDEINTMVEWLAAQQKP